MFKKIIILILVFLTLPSLFSMSCQSESDEYIVKCTLPEHYFVQAFTCLNDDCSIKIENKGEYQELIIPNKEPTVILQNYIELKNIYPNVEVLNVLCEEEFDEKTLTQLNSLLNNYYSKNWNLFSGEKLTIEPLSNSKLEDSKIKYEKTSKELTNCYTTETKIYQDWMFTTKLRKEYCNIEYDNENNCFETTINSPKFLGFVFSNPNAQTLPLIIIIFLVLTITGSLIIFMSKLKREKQLRRFLKPTKHKLLIKLILLIPTIYVVGILINYLMNKKYFFYLTNGTEFFLILITLPVIYFLSACIEYIFLKK